GRLQAVGNDNPQDMHSFQQPLVNSYRGRCQVIVRPEKAGTITVLAKSEGLQEGIGSTRIN
ncbi:MAG TPA: hypothetical protein PKM75_06780, partial [Prolixibacteraceae bacterium]|nr:hypothetical protein [Prolixibacteraceae bacterium]